MEQAAAFLKSQGAEVVEVEGPKEGPIEGDSFQVMLYEFKDGLNKYFAGLGDRRTGAGIVPELIEFNKKDPVELRWFDQKLLEQAQEKGELEAAEYQQGPGGDAQGGARRGDRQADGRAQAGRPDGPDRRPGLEDRPGRRRPLHGQQLVAGGHRRLPERHRAHGLRRGAAGGRLLLRPRLERAGAAGDRFRLRAGDPAPPGAEVPHFRLRPGSHTGEEHADKEAILPELPGHGPGRDGGAAAIFALGWSSASMRLFSLWRRLLHFCLRDGLDFCLWH